MVYPTNVFIFYHEKIDKNILALNVLLPCIHTLLSVNPTCLCHMTAYQLILCPTEDYEDHDGEIAFQIRSFCSVI